MYYVVAPDAAPMVRQFISTLLRSNAGRALVFQITMSPRVNNISTGSVPQKSADNPTTALSNVIAGTQPGQVAGSNTTIDPNTFAAAAKNEGNATDFFAGLSSFTHESEHVADFNAAATLGGAVAAGVAGDRELNNTGGTMFGTAQVRANGILSQLGGAANNYTPDAETDHEAGQIIAYGNLMQAVQAAVQSAQVEQTALNMHVEENCDNSTPPQCI
jgi:hypothetical protein